MRLSSYVRGGYRRYLSWVANYVGYVSFRIHHAKGELLVLISSFQHAYVRNLRFSLKGRVYFSQLPQWHLRAVPIPLRTVDIFHLHFINEMALDLEGTRTFIHRLQTAGTKIVWTAHDLIPHNKDYLQYEPIFALWAQATDGMIHHSHSGEEMIRVRYNFRPDCEHVIIMEAFSRDHANLAVREQRSTIERSYGLAPAPIRIALIGNPRVERNVIHFLEGVRQSSNQNIQVVCWSLRPTEISPKDARIAFAEPWTFVEDDVITERLAMCDLLAMPITPDGEMLTTGLVGDAFGMGLGMLVSSWNFLTETTADAGIFCGDTVNEIAQSLNRLSESDVAQAKRASLRIRKDRTWSNTGSQHLAFYKRLRAKEQSHGLANQT
jgi:hypothetical protein